MKTTKNNQKNRPKLWIILALSVLLVGLGSGAIYAFRGQLFPASENIQTNEEGSSSSPSLDPPTTEQLDAGNDAKEDFINNQDGTGDPTGSTSITISSSTVNGDLYQIRTIIDTVDNNGSCTLTMTASTQAPITQTVGTQSMGAYSVCKGFDVATSLLSTYTWQAKIDYSGNDSDGSTQKEVRV